MKGGPGRTPFLSERGQSYGSESEKIIQQCVHRERNTRANSARPAASYGNALSRVRPVRTCGAARPAPFSRWPGETVVIFASGPSLTVEQCEYVRERHQQGACRAIAINTTWQRVPWCDAIYGYDRAWWVRYYEETPRAAEKITGDWWAAQNFGIKQVDVKPGNRLSTKPGQLYSGLNSGHQAIQFAYQAGAARILLLGYDMQHTGGLRHWHGDHPQGLTNAEGINGWVKHFAPLAKDLEFYGVDVVNCTIETALTCFKKGQIRDYL